MSALLSRRAATAPEASDPRLRGRTYTIPFEGVWSAALGLAIERSRWTVLQADDEEGFIHAEARALLLPFTDDVWIHVGLDAQGQTRVDMVSESRAGKSDLGVNARRIHRFLRALDRRLASALREARPTGEPGPRSVARF